MIGKYILLSLVLLLLLYSDICLSSHAYIHAYIHTCIYTEVYMCVWSYSCICICSFVYVLDLPMWICLIGGLSFVFGEPWARICSTLHTSSFCFFASVSGGPYSFTCVVEGVGT